MIAFGREVRGAKRVEMALVRRAHRRGRDDGHGASGPVGRGEVRAICFERGWARQFRGRFAVVHGTPFLDIHFNAPDRFGVPIDLLRSEEHTSELQSLMRISYAVFCLKKKKTQL